MKKYLFNQDLMGAIVASGNNGTSDSYARKMARLIEAPAWRLSPAENKLARAAAEKVIAVIAEAYTRIKAGEAVYIIQFRWPDSEEGDFTVRFVTRSEWTNEPGIRGGAAYSTRRDSLTISELQDADMASKNIKEFLKAELKDAPLTISTTVRADGTLVHSLVPKAEDNQPRYYASAKWPIWVESPTTLSAAQNVLMIKPRSKPKVVGVDQLADNGVFVYAEGLNSAATWLKEDVMSIVESLPERLVRARELYYREVRARMRANTVAPPANRERTPAERAKALDEFDKHRLARKKKLEESLKGKQAISLLPMTNHGFASSRRWGIEIESGGARGIAAPAGWKRKGDGSLRSAWDGHREETGRTTTERVHMDYVVPANCPTGIDHGYENYQPSEGWVANPLYNPDCELCGDIYETREVPEVTIHTYQSDDCAEFVSPILASMHSQGLEKLLSEIILQPQNDSAGVHVHVEANDLSPRQLGSLVYGYDMVEGLVESSYRRTRRNYAKLRDTKQTMEILKSAKTAEKASRVERGERYTTLNLQALDQHGTVEFRAMGNVYEYDHLIRWAMFCREMVNLAKAGVSVKEWNSVSSWADLMALFAKYGKEYIRAVMDTMGETVPEAPRLDRKDGTISMPTGSEKTSKIVTERSTLSALAATMDEVAVNSRWKATVESSLAAIGEGSQRVLVGALASGNTEV